MFSDLRRQISDFLMMPKNGCHNSSDFLMMPKIGCQKVKCRVKNVLLAIDCPTQGPDPSFSESRDRSMER
jgi:hypothetical protein